MFDYEKDWPCLGCGEYHTPREEGPYFCAADGCTQKQLCIGCTFSCSSCGEDHCEKHIAITPGAHLCAPCLQRTGRKEAA